jgi:FixJ family two-component response regulator
MRTNGPRPTIYVVDSDPLVRRLVEEMLGPEGYLVVGFPSGFELLRSCRPRSPGCVVLNVSSPTENGLRVLGVLAETCPNLPVICTNEHATVGESVQAMRAGACDFLPKPLDPSEVLCAVRAAIKKSDLVGPSQSERSAFLRWRTGPSRPIRVIRLKAHRRSADRVASGPVGCQNPIWP